MSAEGKDEPVQLELPMVAQVSTVRIGPNEWRVKAKLVQSDEWIPTKEAAIRLGRSAETVRRLAQSGELDARQINGERGKIEVTAASVEELKERSRIF